jgi:hypothetical protein
MTLRLIPKQAYIEPDEECALRERAPTVASEAETVRDALDTVPEQDDVLTATLRRIGLLDEQPRESSMTRAERDALQRDLDTSIRRRGVKVSLSDAVIEDRIESDARI